MEPTKNVALEFPMIDKTPSGKFALPSAQRGDKF